MKVEKKIDLVEEIFTDWVDKLGRDYLGYRNHVYRMLHFCFLLTDGSTDRGVSDREKLIIAGVFHDTGIWSDDTLDYIDPSVKAAMAYLESKGKEDWMEEISLMISEHHKLGKYEDVRFPLVEVFRKGDLVDFSLGSFKCGLSKTTIKEVKSAFPNAGFHWMLTKRAAKWTLFHPLNPAPMMKR